MRILILYFFKIKLKVLFNFILSYIYINQKIYTFLKIIILFYSIIYINIKKSNFLNSNNNIEIIFILLPKNYNILYKKFYNIN